MKFILLKLFLLSLAFAVFSHSASAQGHETFDNLNASGNTYTAEETSFTGENEIVWYHIGTRLISETSDYSISGITCGFGGTDNDGYPGYVKATITGGIGELSFNWRSYFTAGDETNRSIKVFINNTEISEFTLEEMGAIQNESFTLDIPGNVLLELKVSGTRQIAIDDIVWTEYVTDAPLLTSFPLALSGFSYMEGEGPSISQSFNLSGFNLDPVAGDISLSANENFEISIDNSAFNTSVLVQYLDGEFIDTPVYVRLKAGLIVGDYNEAIIVEGGSAESLSVNVSGIVNPPLPELTPEGYFQDFVNFISAATFPPGWLPDDDYDYQGDFGSGTSGGLRGNGVVGFQLTGTAPNNNFNVSLSLINNTGETIEYLEIEYLGKVARENQEGTPKWLVSVDGTAVPELEYSTENGADELINHIVSGLNIPDGEVFTVEWFTTSAGTTGTRRQIGITDVNISIEPTPQVINPVFTPPAGSYIEAFDLEITTETEGATVFYKINEDDSWTEYTNAIAINTNTSVWAQATKDEMLDSDIVFAVYDFLEGNITSVSELEAIQVEVGTLFNELVLPATVEVILDDGENSMAELEVTWLEGDYDPELIATQIVYGEIVLAGQITNNNDLLAEISVIVLEEIIEYEIVAVEDIDDISVEYGTLFEELQLPENAIVTLDNDETETLDVIWMLGNYNGSVPDTYTLIGELQLISGILNTNDISASINVTVNPEPVEVVIAGWTFPESGIIGADLGLDENLGNEISREPTFEGNYSFYGGASTQSISTTSWSDGEGTKYWLVEFSTLSYGELNLSSAQQSSNTGPAEFKVQYKYGNTEWVDLENSDITVANNFTTGVLNEIELPDILNNKYSVSLRWIMTSNTAVGGDAVAGAGTNRIDDIIVKGWFSDDFKRIVTGVEELEDVDVEVFTTIFEDLPLPETVLVFFDDGGEENLPVIWHEGDYDGNVLGTYTLEGDIVIDNNMENPDIIKATINIIVREPIVYYTVTFNVDMSPHASFDPDNDLVYIRGDINNWGVPGTDDPNQLLTQVDDSMIFSITFELEEGTYEYKYYMNPGTSNPEGGDQRSVDITEDIVINDTWLVTGINEVIAEGIKIYPNPANDLISISSKYHILKIEIINMQGQIVMQTDNIAEKINISEFKNGVYFIKINTEFGLVNKKIIINR